jgi:hypothetical protein
MPNKPFHNVIAGNLTSYRTEAEISDEAGNVLCVVYEDHEGWHTDSFDREFDQNVSDFAAAVRDAKEMLSRYVNRRGDNPPHGLTAGALALWLMVRDDGTAMGQPVVPVKES